MKPVGHCEFFTSTPLLEFKFDAEPLMILMLVIPRIIVIGLAICDGVGFAGECGRCGKRETYRNGNEGYKESFLHEHNDMSIRMAGATWCVMGMCVTGFTLFGTGNLFGTDGLDWCHNPKRDLCP